MEEKTITEYSFNHIFCMHQKTIRIRDIKSLVKPTEIKDIWTITIKLKEGEVTWIFDTKKQASEVYRAIYYKFIRYSNND